MDESGVDGGIASSRPPQFDASVTRAADQVVVAVRGEIDLASAERFRQVVEAAIVPGGRLVIDLAGINFIDSTGLGVMARAHDRLAASAGAVIIRSPSASTRKILNICGLDRVLTMEEGDGTDDRSGGSGRSNDG